MVQQEKEHSGERRPVEAMPPKLGPRLDSEWLGVTLHSIGDAVIATDSHSIVTFMNPVAEALTGWTAAEAVGQQLATVFRIINEETRSPVENPVAKALREGTVVGLANHTLLIARDGAERAIDDSAAPIRAADGRIAGVVLVFRDVSQQRASQIERGRLAALVESSEDAILGQTLEGIVTDWNGEAERLFGYTADEVVGKSIFSTIVPSDRKGELLDVLKRVRQGERVDPFETVRQSKHGQRIAVSIRISPVRDAEGRNVGASAIDRDISQRRLAERRRNARLAVTQILAQETSIEIAAAEILAAVCSALEWDAGCFWRIETDQDVLRCREFRQESSRNLDAFRNATLKLAVQPGNSLPGRVWKSGMPIWIHDVVADPQFIRAPQARDVGLHGGFACPVIAGRRFLGVIEWFSHEIQQPDDDLLEMMATIGSQIGQFIERRQAELDLRRSEQELSDFFENAVVGLHWVGPDGTVLRVNQAELDLLGYSRDEYVGHHIAEFHADQDVIDDILGRLTAGEQLCECEARMRCKDGSIREVIIDSNVLWEDGRFVHSRCFTRDITLRKRAEEALRRSEARKDAMFQAALDCIITIDHEGKIVEFNPAAEATFGYRRQDVLGRGMAELIIPPRLRERHRLAVAQYLATGDGPILDQRIEMPALRADGAEFPVELAVSQITTQGPPMFTAFLRDITEREQMVQSLRDNERRLEGLVETAADAIITIDQFGVIQSINPAAEQMFAYSSREAVGQNVNMLMPEPYHSEHGSYIANYLRTGEAKIIGIGREVVGRRKDGCTFPMELAVSEFGIGERRYFTGIVRDITDRKKVEQQLKEADRRKDEFLAMLAHELRNPLAPIRSGLDILALEDDSHREAIELMQAQVQHLVRLVDDLLDVSRIMRGRVELRKEPVELSSLINRSVETVRALANSHQQELLVSEPNGPIWLDADPVRVVQVVENLLSNAVKYTDAGGRIELSAASDDGHAVVTVRDNGVGINPELLPHVFELFTQSSRSLDRAQGGLGIGLTLVQELVQMHDGTVTAHSLGPGQGSTFVVRLPLTEVASPSSEAIQRPRIAQSRRILIVDDNGGAARMLAILLANLGDHEVDTVYDGPSALVKITETHPEVVLLDIGLPGMDGYEVARSIRKMREFDDVVLIALTGYGQEEDRQRSREAGFDRHLVKPVEASELHELLAELQT